MAASICNDHDTTPRGVYQDHLEELKGLMRKGTGVPPPPPAPVNLTPPTWLGRVGLNLARTAKITVSGNYNTKQYPASNINDGRYDISDNSLRWVSDKTVPGIIELAWNRPQTFSAVRIITGQSGRARPQTPITAFKLQRHGQGRWHDISNAAATGNTSIDWHAKFDRVTASRLRLVVASAPGDLTRIWELELYDLTN